MSEWKRVKIGSFLEKKSILAEDIDNADELEHLGVSNKLGITVTDHRKSKEISKHQYIEHNYFAYNPYRINVGSIGLTPENVIGLVSPAYVVFKTKENLLLPELLLDFLKSSDGLFQINQLARGTVRKALRFSELCDIEMVIPPIKNQIKILNIKQSLQKEIEGLSTEISNQQTYLTKLRQAILQEAIEGKLTADWRVKNPVEKGNPDFDAAALLATIKAEKQKLIAAGKIKKEKPLAPINADDVPFALPDGWVWVRLGDIVDLITKGSSPNWQGVQYVEKGTGIRFITSKNVDSYKLNLKIETFVHSKFNEVEPRSMLSYGDILTNIVGASIGRTAIYDLNDIANINQAVCLIRYQHNFVDKNFFLHFMNSPWLIKKMHEDEFSTGRANLSMTNIANFPFTLPPLAEQHAIVERVDRLLESVNALEQQVQERKTYAEQLMQAVLKEAFAG